MAVVVVSVVSPTEPTAQEEIGMTSTRGANMSRTRRCGAQLLVATAIASLPLIGAAPTRHHVACSSSCGSGLTRHHVVSSVLRHRDRRKRRSGLHVPHNAALLCPQSRGDALWLRGGGESDDAEEQPITSTTSASAESDDNDGTSAKSPSWGFFSKAKSSQGDEGDGNDGSVEITMNSKGQGNVKLDIEPINQMARQFQQGNQAAKLQPTKLPSTKTDARTPISQKFPISRSELPHFACMSVMMFLFIYVFTTVRDTKDTLVVSNCGAEAIPFLKLYAVMPCAAMFIVGYSKLSNVLGKQALFYVTLVPFFVFYAVFAFVLFPNRDAIHFAPAGGAPVVGNGALNAALNLVRYWSYSLFFVVSELWASAGVPLLFWQVSLEESRRGHKVRQSQQLTDFPSATLPL